MSDSRAAALHRIGRVVADLAEINDRLVFIGGAVLPLLVDVEARFDEPRVTKDVDAVTATASYGDAAAVEAALRRASYRDAQQSHVGRYISPTNEVFDISFAGEHVGATGTRTDVLAIQSAMEEPGPPRFRHVSATGLLLMKVAAHFDRGMGAPYESKDLADLAVLLTGVPGLTIEVEARSEEVREHAASAARRLLESPDLDEYLRSHLRDRRPILPDTPDSLAREALDRLDVLAALGS